MKMVCDNGSLANMERHLNGLKGWKTYLYRYVDDKRRVKCRSKIRSFSSLFPLNVFLLIFVIIIHVALPSIDSTLYTWLFVLVRLGCRLWRWNDNCFPSQINISLPLYTYFMQLMLICYVVICIKKRGNLFIQMYGLEKSVQWWYWMLIL